MDSEMLYLSVFAGIVGIGCLLRRYNRLHDGYVRAMLDQRATDGASPDTPVAGTSAPTSQCSSPDSSQGEPGGQESDGERTVMDMWLKFIHDHNCDVQFDQENNNVFWFQFQGGNYRVIVQNHCVFELLFPQIHDVPMDDYEAISRVRRAINEVNKYSMYTLFYTFDEQAARMLVHVRMGGIIVPETKNPDDLLYSMLSGCFKAQRCFAAELETLENNEKQEHKAEDKR